MKANPTVYIIIGILLVVSIYSLWKLNQVQGTFKKVSGRLLEAEPTISTSTEVPAEKVNAGEFISKLTDKLKNNVDSVTLNFNKTA